MSKLRVEGFSQSKFARAQYQRGFVSGHPCGIIRPMNRKAIVLWIAGLVLAGVAVLGAVQLSARWRFLTRGQPAGFPPFVEDTQGSSTCVNVTLEQYVNAELAVVLDLIAEGGFAWVRQRFPWQEIEPAPGEYRWERWDEIVAGAQARDLKILAVLDGAPAWAGSPPDLEAFAAFAGAFAARYGDEITYYQIWHNPNLGDAWDGAADPYAYTALLAKSAGAIRAADPGARIVLGGLAPTVEVGERNYAEDVFLEMLYVAGAAPYFDVVAVQPYGFSAPPGDRAVSRDRLNFSRAILVREALKAHGEEHKAVWASHYGWNSKPEGWPGPASIWGSVDEAVQAAYTVGALERARREWPWMGVMCLNSFQPRPEGPAQPVPDAEEHWGFAIVGPGGAPRPVYDAVRAWAADAAGIAPPGSYPAGTALAAFEGTWTLGPQGADIGQSGDRVTLPFEGTGAALTVRRGPYRAFLYVTVDGKPAPALPRDREGRAYVVLYDPLAAIATVPLAEDLPYGPHIVEVVAERGWGQWALADWRIANAPDVRAHWLSLVFFVLLGLAGLGLAFYGMRRLSQGAWDGRGRALRGAWERLREGGQLVVSLLVSALYLFSAWQAMMGQEIYRRLGEGGEMTAVALAATLFYFSPWFIVTLGAGLVTSLIVFLNPALGLVLTVLTAPLYMHPLSLLGKSFALAELILLPTAAGWAVRVWGGRGERRSVPALGAIGYFVGLAILATLFAGHQRVALRELRLVILEPVLFYVILTTLPMEARERRRVVDAFVLSGVMVAMVGLVQYFLLGDVITAEGGMRRLHSVYGSPNNVGLYLGRILPLLVAIVLWGGPALTLRAFRSALTASRRRWLYALVLLSVSAALLLSLSRGAIVVGIPAAFLVMGVLAGPKWRRVTLIALVVGLLALVPLLRTPRFAGLLDPTQGTAGFRLSLWHSAWGMIRDHPLLGVGPDNFLYAYRTRYVLPTAWEEFNLSHPHNVVMDFAVRLGLPGLIALVWLQVAFWRRSLPLRRAPDAFHRALALGLMGSMADFLGHGLVDASYFVIDLAYAFFLSLAVGVWLSRGEEV